MSTVPTPDPNSLNTIIDRFLNSLSFINGAKTYIAGAGLIGLAVYQASTGDYVGAYTSLMGALAAVGVRHAISKSA